MKEFLEASKYRPGSTAFTLFKKTFGANLLVSLLLGIVSFFLFLIVVLALLSSKYNEIIEFSKKYSEVAKDMSSQSQLTEMMSQFILGFNPFTLVVINLVFILLFSMILTAVLKVNDNYVRRLETEPIKAISSVFSKKYLHLALGFISVLAIMGLINQAFTVILVLSTGISSFAFVFFMFIFILFIIIIFFRFMLVFPAAVSGNMNFIKSIVYSWKNLGFRRAGMLFILSLAMFIVLAIGMIVLVLVIAAIGSVNETFGKIFTILSFFLFYYMLLNYTASAMTTLYFRYSNETSEFDETIHLNEFNSDSF